MKFKFLINCVLSRRIMNNRQLTKAVGKEATSFKLLNN
ncbi:hypothetical protein C900_01358 [Fulvivirga imtechensis AK7]|uniref:Uncharacterized protein n=1 Tax=Fulvivirga imtechensis AK7 TaxID=1237149 RepID=L8K042_9BACT|nr:hypothetical protein C900_01358 [Fulvivirga imtechensis AK7]